MGLFAVRLSGFTLIVLDKNALIETLLPALERRYFPAGDDPGFALRVTRQDRPGDALYESQDEDARKIQARGGRGAAGAALRRCHRRGSPRDASPLGRAGKAPARRADRHRRSSPSRRSATFGGPATAPAALAVGVARHAPASGPSRWPTAAARWMPSSRRARRRNLLVGFTVLILLGTTTVLLALSARGAPSGWPRGRWSSWPRSPTSCARRCR